MDNSNSSENNIEIDETDESQTENSWESSSNSEAEIIPKNKSNHKKNRIADDSSDDEAIEEKAFSAITRQSITGNYTRNYVEESDNDSLIIDKSDDDEISKINSSEEIQDEPENSKLEEMKSALESMKKLLIAKNSLPDNGLALQERIEELQLNIQKQQQLVKSFSIENESVAIVTDKEATENTFELLTSTFLDTSAAVNEGKNIAVEILSPIVNLAERRSQVIDLSSDDESIAIGESIQIKGLDPIRKTVSQSFYETEVGEYNVLVNGLKSCEKLLQARANLPDGGTKLNARIEKMKEQIVEKKKKLAAMEVDEHESARSRILKDFNYNNSNISHKSDSVQEISSDDIKIVADIKPKFFGTQGLQTFNNQKSLTVENLKIIQTSLNTCPPADVFAEQPKSIKIELMKHQKHALAWMMWREKQKPRGGFLGDDMGLGKTLSMIALIIAQKEIREQKSSDSDENDESSSNDWKQKGRKDLYDGGTLIICPASLLKQWETEINSRVKRNTLSVVLHHGNSREYKARRLARNDIVITTYHVALNENKKKSCLYEIKWNRIILDEAHVTRNHKSLTSIAVCALEAKYRWALSGTPIQNKEFDLYAVLKFLRCIPFDDLYYWKTWIEGKGVGGSVRLQTLMKAILLRRTKQQLLENGDINELPSKKVDLLEVTLSKNEMNVYQKVLVYSQSMFVQFLNQRLENNHGISENYNREKHNEHYQIHERFREMHGEVKSVQILVLLLRLRQICCHPSLIHAMLEDSDNISFDGQNVSGNDLDLLGQLQNLNINNENSEGTNQASNKVLLKSNPVFDKAIASTKIKKFLEILEQKILPFKEKAIVVSQFKSYLDIVKIFLEERGISSCDFNGTVPVKDRNDIVVSFNRENSGPKVMLLSLTSGGVGLNLVGANHLFLLDLHWNPQLESQAEDRIYRFGQKRAVNIYKLYCKGTVEEKILKLQQKKLEIAHSVLTGTKKSATKLTIDDLKSLFGV